MSLFDEIDCEMQKDLVNFCKQQSEIPYPHTLALSLKVAILQEIIARKCDITGYAKNDAKGTAYVEFTWGDTNEQ